MSDDVSLRRKRKSRNKNMDYCEPIDIHSSTRKSVQLVPVFISRSNGDKQISIKIECKKTDDESGPASISLDHDATLRLSKALHEVFGMAQHTETGKYVTIKMDDGIANLNDVEPDIAAKVLVDILKNKEITKHLSFESLGSDLTSMLQGSMRIQELSTAVIELKNLLESGVDREQPYQEWCQKHSWAFGNQYFVADDVRTITSGDKVDLLLPNVMGGFRDIVELKRPCHHVLMYDRSHKNFYFSTDTSKAIGQCQRYLDLLHDHASNGLLDHKEIVAFHPQATIVIGRSNDWEHEHYKGLHGLNAGLSRINVITYDQLLDRSERLLATLTGNPQDVDSPDPWEFEEIPF